METEGWANAPGEGCKVKRSGLASVRAPEEEGARLGGGFLKVDRGWPQQPTAYPVHDENLAHVQLLLQEFGCDGYRVEEAESPAGREEKGQGVQPWQQFAL